MAFGVPLLALRVMAGTVYWGHTGRQAGSWGTTLLSCTLSPKQKGKRGLTPAERVVKGKRVVEKRGGGGGAAPEPPSKRAHAEHRPWPMQHRSDAKHVSEGQNAGGTA